MTLYYVRIEGVNLDKVLSDTPQVSVQRGASFLLRQAALDLPSCVPLSLEPISVGASIGLYECDTDSASDAKITEVIREWLATHCEYKYFTFVVSTIPASEYFFQDHEQLLLACRLQQMQLPSLSLAGLDSHTSEVCGWNGILPGNAHIKLKKEEAYSILPISQSVLTRYEAGRKLRQDFYSREAGTAFENYKFTNDLHSLANDSDKGQLSDKLAVFYLDGNRFGDIQRQFADSKEKYLAFDNTLRKYLKSFLSDFLLHAKNSPDYLNPEEQLRIEILMWGGDEVLILVPAWCGLDLLTFFYEHVSHWKIEQIPLTFSAGILFANVKTPLAQLRAYVKEELTEHVKSEIAKNSVSNAFEYLILESVDCPAEDIASYRKKVYGEISEYITALSPLTSDGLRDLAELKSQLPKSQCQQLVLAILQDDNISAFSRDTTEDVSSTRRALSRFEIVSPGVEKLFDQITSRHFIDITGKPIAPVWRWTHFLELWDYLP